MERGKLGFAAVIAVLLAVMLAAAAASGVTYTRQVAAFEAVVEAGPGLTVRRVSWPGLVEVEAWVPEGVAVYLLSPLDYLAFERRGELPAGRALEPGVERVLAENVEAIVVNNTLSRAVTLRLGVTRYSVEKPYSALSIVSYIACLATICVIVAKIVRVVEEKEGAATSSCQRQPWSLCRRSAGLSRRSAAW